MLHSLPTYTPHQPGDPVWSLIDLPAFHGSSLHLEKCPKPSSDLEGAMGPGVFPSLQPHFLPFFLLLFSLLVKCISFCSLSTHHALFHPGLPTGCSQMQNAFPSSVNKYRMSEQINEWRDIEENIESCSVERLRVDKGIMELITKLW